MLAAIRHRPLLNAHRHGRIGLPQLERLGYVEEFAADERRAANRRLKLIRSRGSEGRCGGSARLAVKQLRRGRK